MIIINGYKWNQKNEPIIVGKEKRLKLDHEEAPSSTGFAQFLNSHSMLLKRKKSMIGMEVANPSETS